MIFEGLDNWVIGRCEAFSHWTQRSFGLMSDTWVRASITTSLIFYMTSDLHVNLFWKIMLGYIFVMSFALSFRPRKYIGVGERTMNISKLRYRRQRIIGLFLCFMFIVPSIMSFNFWFHFMVLSEYFYACDDLPPSTSKFRLWLESFGRKGAPNEA